MPSVPERNLDDIVSTLRDAKSRQRGASLLIGAGCSVSAGIPLATQFVEEISGKHKPRLQHLAKRTYPACMGELAPNERHDIIGPHIDKAKINWAHMAIAQLMKEGYVSRILTTNFDPLVVRACAMVGVFPAVYDLAASQTFKADRVHEPAVFYLHGQRAGFVTLHTEGEVARHKTAVAPVFEDAGRGRVWMVCGYSGDNDPVFDHLADVTSFGYPLYWVGYKDAEPADHVRTRLLQNGKYAFYVRGYDADSFFVELAQQLDCFPPRLIAKPFTHLLEMTDLLAPFTIGASTIDLKEAARIRIQAAIDQFETNAAPQPASEDLQADALDANTLLFSGKYEEVLELFRRTTDPSEELRDAAAWALIGQGNEWVKQARSAETSENVDSLWKEAIDKYRAALQIKPNKHEALYNWGTALADQAETKSGEEADALVGAACEKYAAAVQIKPDKYEALHNWGTVLSSRAMSKSGGEADALWDAACEKFAAAAKIKPDDHEVLYNWGSALDDRARMKSDEEADALWDAACEKYAAAVQIKPNYHEALNNWGITLADRARTKSGEEADALWNAAYEKYATAVQTKPDYHDAVHNWGIALADLAKRKSGKEADALWSAACEKYAAAVQIKPDKHEALSNWVVALLTQASNASAERKERLLSAATEKCSLVNEIIPGKGSYNLACIAGIRGDAESCRRWLLHAKEHGTLEDREHMLADPDLAAYRDEAWFREIVGTTEAATSAR